MNIESRFEISRQIRNDSGMKTAHYHSYHELYYLASGECTILIQNNVYKISGGMLTLIPAKALHKTTYPPEIAHERIYIEFTENYISELVSEFGDSWFRNNLFNKILILPQEKQEQIDFLMKKIQAESFKYDALSKFNTKLYFQELLIMILQYQKDSAELSLTYTDAANALIQSATNFISEHHHQNITLNDVAKHVHLNPSYFSKKFKTMTGIGFKEYLTNIRITHAERLLLETNQSITEIASACGFENSNYFGDAFKTFNNCCPSDFRKQKGDISH